MAPRIPFRKPYPTNEDGTPVLTTERESRLEAIEEEPVVSTPAEGGCATKHGECASQEGECASQEGECSSQKKQSPSAPHRFAVSDYEDLFTSMAIPKAPSNFTPVTARSPSTSAESSPPCRPATTDFVARRLIGAALGIKVEAKKDEKSIMIGKVLRVRERGERMAIWGDFAAGAA